MPRKHGSLIPVALIFASSPTTVQSPPPAADRGSQTLSVGVIVQLTTPPVLYVMNQIAGIDAVDLRTGTLLWHSAHVAAPLLARGNKLLAVAPQLRGRPGDSFSRSRPIPETSWLSSQTWRSRAGV